MSETNKIILKILFIGFLFLIGYAFSCYYYFNDPTCISICTNVGTCFIGYSIGLKLYDII